MTKQQQIDTLQKQLDAANEQIATIDNALKEQYLNTAINIISDIKSWFVGQCEHSYKTYKDINYNDVYKFLDNYRKVIESTAPKYTPSVLCELSTALSEMRRVVAEQRIVITRQEKTIKSLKIKLNATYGAKRIYSLGDLYSQEAISEYSKQQREEDNNDERRD